MTKRNENQNIILITVQNIYSEMRHTAYDPKIAKFACEDASINRDFPRASPPLLLRHNTVNNHEIDPDAQAKADKGGCCFSAAKEVVVNADIERDDVEVSGCCKPAGGKECSVKAETNAEVKVQATGCCSAPTTHAATGGIGQGKKDDCCSGKDEHPIRTPKRQDGCCSSTDNPAQKLDVQTEVKLDDCCASKSNAHGITAPMHGGNVNRLSGHDEMANNLSDEDKSAIRLAEVVPPCCEGIASNCCDGRHLDLKLNCEPLLIMCTETCLDELAFRECEKDGCIEDVHEIGSTTGFTRRKGIACDNHVKSVRQRWATKLETLGCLCRSLLAMNQSTCCTSLRKQRPTGSTIVSRESSAGCPQKKVPYNRSISTGGTSSSASQKGQSMGPNKKACCTGKISTACRDERVVLDEALIISPMCTKTRRASCCADKVVSPMIVETVDPEQGTSTTEHVVIGISGMTCTGCETKLNRTLGNLPISNLKTSLILGRAEFDLNPTMMSAADIVLHLERTTEFKCTELTTRGSELHVIPESDMKTFLRQDWPEGVTAMEKTSKLTVRICFDAKIVGARHLLQGLQPSAKLAPQDGDSSLSAGSKHVRHVGLTTLLSAALTIPVLILSWAPLAPRPVVHGSVSLALASLVQIVIAGPFYSNALKALFFSRIVEMDLLIVLSTSAAYIFSVVSFAYILRGNPLSTGEFFETSTLLVTLIMVGRYVSALARQKAVESVAMRSLQDSKAILVTEDPNTEVEIDARLLHYDDVFKVMPDSRFVTDGVVFSGVSEANEAMVTGESKPVEKSPGSTVIAGSVNGFGTLLIRTTRLPGENTISSIADMIDEAKLSKPKLQDIADKVASYFVPVIIALSIITFCIWIAIGTAVRGQSASEATVQAITYAITVLIVSCPCAIGLAVPMVVVIANGVAAERGVVFKSAHVVELGRKVTHVIFDKTGTLTTGEPAVVAEEYLTGDPEVVRSQLLGLVSGIKHPVAVAIASHLVENEVAAVQIANVRSVAGKGVEAAVSEDTTIRAGNSRWLGIETHPRVHHLLSQGYTVFCVEIGGSLCAVFGLQDQPRAETVTVIKTLQERGIVVSIVSGDDKEAVATTASLLGISTFRAQCSPADKRDFLQSIANAPTNGKKSVTLFVGDGANDGPALAQATIGVHISPASSTSDIASDAARAAADAVLLRPTLEGLLLLTAISKAAVRRIAFNFLWSFVYNLFAVLLAAGAFVNVRIPPEYAGLGELVSVVPVVAVAVMLKWVKF
ncbi:heavy metal translocatin [Aureobasidium pullulans]|nr:heavy metal translocatin [Aureobasidium pullulans]